LAVAIAIAMLTGASGCIVVATDHFYAESALVFDERLVGTWLDDADHVTIVVEPAEWRSYRIRYDHPTEKGVLTGYLFKVGQTMYLDLMPMRGQDFGSFALPAHSLVQLSVGSDIVVRSLRFDWFVRAVEDHTLPATLHGMRGERSQIVLSSGAAALHAWLTTRPADDPAFGPDVVFKKQ
jgi:hypothetical protein